MVLGDCFNTTITVLFAIRVVVRVMVRVRVVVMVRVRVRVRVKVGVRVRVTSHPARHSRAFWFGAHGKIVIRGSYMKGV